MRHLSHSKVFGILIYSKLKVKKDATANLHEDFFLTHVLSDESDEQDDYAVHEADPADERLSMLWTMVSFYLIIF